MSHTFKVLLAMSLVGCATAPKPPEFEAFEKMRTHSLVPAAQKKSPQLVAESETLFARARKEWQSKDLEDSRRDALLGGIKLKTAIALAEQEAAASRMQVLNREFSVSEEEYGRVYKELTGLNEQVALLQKLGEARSSAASDKARMGQQLTEEQARSSTRDKIAAAELAIKTADSVNAANLAKVEYGAATDALARAQTEVKQGNWSAAQTSADQARQKAAEATTAARPLYDSSEQSKTDRTRHEALGRDAAALSGVAVKLERRGDMQRLVLTLRGIFVKKATTLSPTSDAVVDAVSGLLKKYPAYSVQVIGHTDKKGKHGELVSLSQARAQSVYSALLTRGVDAKRMSVSGLGPDEPLADKGSRDRVEIIFTY